MLLLGSTAAVSWMVRRTLSKLVGAQNPCGRNAPVAWSVNGGFFGSARPGGEEDTQVTAVHLTAFVEVG